MEQKHEEGAATTAEICGQAEGVQHQWVEVDGSGTLLIRHPEYFRENEILLVLEKTSDTPVGTPS